MSEWQDIETAPKDETPILVGAPGYRATLVRWSDNGWHYPFTTRRLKAYPPTHWMPLPKSPEGT